MLDREKLGKIVREVWVECAHELPNPKPSNLLPWSKLDEWNKEVDRKIGERIQSEVLSIVAQRLQDIMESPANPGDGVSELIDEIYREDQ